MTEHKPLVFAVIDSAPGLENFKKIITFLPGSADSQAGSKDVSYFLCSGSGNNLNNSILQVDIESIAKMSHLDLEPLNPGTHLRSSKIYYYKPTSNNKSGFAQQMDLMKKWSDNITGVIMLSPPVADYIDCLDFIKEKGGFTLALDSLEKSSEHTFDYLVSYKEAGAKITEIIKLKEDLCQKTVIDFQSRDFITLLKMLFNYSGCDFSGYKDLTLKRRITRRMILKKIFDFKKYIDYLSNNKDELQALYTELFISVTSFFRDPDAFNVLAQNLETKLLDFDAERIFRVWVPACAHGHEAFSIAMIISWILKKINRQINYIIFATDINDASIDFARKAQYPKGAIEHINQYNPDFTENFFTINEGFYQIIKSIREKTIFAKQDIIGDPSFSRVDLISCRNLLIYFKNDLQDKLLSMFHYSLNSEGLLFLGKSESTGRLDYFFAPINKEQKLFKQRNVIRSKPGSFRKKSSFIEHDLKKTHHTKDSAPLVISDIVNSALASFFGPPSILVSKNMELLYIHRDADRFFKIKPGEAGLNILDLAVPQIRAGLSSAIYRARREKSRVTIKNISLNSESGALDIDITANPLKEMENTSEFMLISFDSNSEKTIKPQFSGDARGFKEQYIVELEQELEASRNNLQITIEDIEAANEELQSLNEELQSTNEEFETSNEELQAVNEELCTVNEELNAKSLELTEANLYLENILKKMEIPLILIDNNLNIIKFTPPIKKIFKICDQHLGDPLLNYIDNDQIPGFSELLNSVFSKNVNLGMIINYNKRVYTMKASIYEGAKYSKGAILTFVDITSEHERAQEFKALAENSPDTVIRLSKNFTCLFANKNIKNLTNLLPADIIGKSIDDFNFPGPALEIWKNALNSSLKKRGDNSFIFEITQKSKKSIYECRIAKEHTFSNKVASLLVVVRDITLRHDTQMLLKKLFENIPVMILIFDSDFNIQSVNRCFEETTGWSSQEALSMDLLQECYPDEDYQNKALNYMRQLSTEWKQFDLRIKSGEYLKTIWSNIRADNNKIIGIGLDVTHKTNLENMLRQKQRIEALGTLAGGIAHDFNNILAAIIGYSQLSIEKNAYREDCNEELEEIITAGMRARDLVQQILTFSQKSLFKKEHFLLNSILEKSIKMLRSTIPSSIDINTQFTDTKLFLKGDKSQIYQIVTNIVTNARLAIKDDFGTIKITLDCTCIPELPHDSGIAYIDNSNECPELNLDAKDKCRYARICISDTGSGIAPDVLPKIFEPYFTTRPVGKGSGLGLAVVHGIVKSLKGEITVKSKPDKGSCFIIHLPLADTPDRSETSLNSRHKIPRGTEKILFVDDEHNITNIQKQLLSRLGYTVNAFTDPELALEDFLNRPGYYDLIITDMSMPRLPGDMFIRHIRNSAPRLPVIMCSGHSDKLNNPALIDLGIKRVLIKPIKISELARAVRDALDTNIIDLKFT